MIFCGIISPHCSLKIRNICGKLMKLVKYAEASTNASGGKWRMLDDIKMYNSPDYEEFNPM